MDASVEIHFKDKERDLKVRAAYQEYDTELIEAQRKQQEIYNNAIPKVVTHQQNAYKVLKIAFRKICCVTKYFRGQFRQQSIV